MARKETAMRLVAKNISSSNDQFSTSKFMRGSHGIRADIAVSAISGSTNVVFTLQGYDAAAQAWFDLLATAAISAVGRDVLQVGAGLPATANKSINAHMPDQFRVKASGTATSVTATVQITYVGD